jgi:hypothetical protein
MRHCGGVVMVFDILMRNCALWGIGRMRAIAIVNSRFVTIAEGLTSLSSVVTLVTRRHFGVS